ncbi:unnamed protein product [Trypanosoma congolense IL3000]|uniref:WGS project CAEQ00000000 data, annotated contig 543 n=1 Tax=Trypanosoma congolense (strain IL3000) TaxID=1068625 RepID=F9WGT1_TRYCI|nr:unnamed protein product [Trypanosoma congolense IL3000]
MGVKNPPVQLLPVEHVDGIEAIFLEGIQSPEQINLYEFLEPLCTVFKHDYNGFTLGDFLRDPARCIHGAFFRKELIQKLLLLMTRLRIHTLVTIRHLTWRNITTLRDWANRREHTRIEKIPQRMLRYAASPHPPSSPSRPTPPPKATFYWTPISALIFLVSIGRYHRMDGWIGCGRPGSDRCLRWGVGTGISCQSPSPRPRSEVYNLKMEPARKGVLQNSLKNPPDTYSIRKRKSGC